MKKTEVLRDRVHGIRLARLSGGSTVEQIEGALIEIADILETNTNYEPSEKPMETMRILADKQYRQGRQVMEQRDEILRAFVAKYGCGPEEIEIVENFEPNAKTWSVRKKIPPASAITTTFGFKLVSDATVPAGEVYIVQEREGPALPKLLAIIKDGEVRVVAPASPDPDRPAFLRKIMD